MKKSMKNIVLRWCFVAAASLLLSIVSCDEIDSSNIVQPVSDTYSEITSEDSTLTSETTTPVSSTTTEITLKTEDVTKPETTLSPDTTQSEVTSAETTATSQDITATETVIWPETTNPPQETTTAEISETTAALVETTNPYTEGQLEQINKLLEIAYNYDHDIAENGIGSIHIKWPQVEQFQPFEAIITPIGGNYNNESNFKFEIDKNTALKFITTIDRDLSKSKLPEGLSPSKIYELREYALHGVRFISNKNNNIINKYLSLFTDFIPEDCFYFEDKEQISDDQMDAVNNYLYSVNDSYKKGIFSISLTESSKDNKNTYYIDVFPSTTDETGRSIIDWNFPRCIFQISEHEYNKYSDLLNLSNCYETVVESQGQTIYDINLMERIPDTLKKQILNLVYETLVEYKKINDPSLEK